jgi:hypothetical protein
LVSLLIALAVSFPLSTGVEAGPRHAMASWQHLSSEQQAILQPLRDRWDRMPYKQRERLLGLVAHYPKMSALEKERFERRLPQWAALTRAERDLTRKRYLAFSRLPETRKAQFRKQWQDQRMRLSGEVPAGP